MTNTGASADIVEIIPFCAESRLTFFPGIVCFSAFLLDLPLALPLDFFSGIPTCFFSGTSVSVFWRSPCHGFDEVDFGEGPSRSDRSLGATFSFSLLPHGAFFENLSNLLVSCRSFAFGA